MSEMSLPPPFQKKKKIIINKIKQQNKPTKKLPRVGFINCFSLASFPLSF